VSAEDLRIRKIVFALHQDIRVRKAKRFLLCERNGDRFVFRVLRFRDKNGELDPIEKIKSSFFLYFITS
jgi:hypothetical protein